MSTSAPSSPVIVYWRPGCPWCAMLRRKLARAGIATVERNIWEDAEAAAAVRRAAAGNETVPTVVVGEVALVNPSLRTVRKALAAGASTHASTGAPEGSTRAAAHANGALSRARRTLGLGSRRG